jgi:predicted Zn-dependent protease
MTDFLVRRRAFAVFLTAALALPCAAPAFADQAQNQWEMQAGQQEYQQLAQKGEIVPSSPYYAILNPIAQRIAQVANPQYFTPFHFILVNERAPNAFAVPGGNVYVTMGMMTFAKTQDELAGVLCHEVSHDIHHDVYDNNRKDQGLQTVAGVLGMLVGNNMLGQMALGLGAGAQAMKFSRAVESNADHAGAYTCASAGYNPHGMVWLFDRFHEKPGSAPPEFLSDHPRDDHRVSDLENLFKNDPATFGRFSADPSTSTPIKMPAQQGQGYPPQPGQGYPPQGLPPQDGPPRQGLPPQDGPPQQGLPPQDGPPSQGPPTNPPS